MRTATMPRKDVADLARHDPLCPPWRNPPPTAVLHVPTLIPPIQPANPSAAPLRPPAVRAPSPSQPKLLDRLREALRSRHYSRRTEEAYHHWVKRFIFFHNVRHPAEMAEPEINALLTHLAVKEKVSASTQNQALSALLFLYRHCRAARRRRSGVLDRH
jgi:integrase-like protein